MNARVCAVIPALVAAGPLPAAAGDIATWVDDAGVTHFGNPQFAPSDARPVEVQPANGMVVPEGPRHSSRSSGPATVVLEKRPNREMVGWRGHEWNVSRRPRRHR